MFDEKTADLANHISKDPPIDEEGESVESILTKFVVLSEWVDAEGRKYLVRRSGTGAGENLVLWDLKGLLHEALYGEW